MDERLQPGIQSEIGRNAGVYNASERRAKCGGCCYACFGLCDKDTLLCFDTMNEADVATDTATTTITTTTLKPAWCMGDQFSVFLLLLGGNFMLFGKPSIASPLNLVAVAVLPF